MRIDDPQLRKQFGGAGPCEHCHRFFPSRECAHVFACGMASGNRIDHVLNLCSLCRRCHDANHWGKAPTRNDLLAIVSVREGKTVDEIQETIWSIQRAPKGWTHR